MQKIVGRDTDDAPGKRSFLEESSQDDNSSSFQPSTGLLISENSSRSSIPKQDPQTIQQKRTRRRLSPSLGDLFSGNKPEDNSNSNENRLGSNDRTSQPVQKSTKRKTEKKKRKGKKKKKEKEGKKKKKLSEVLSNSRTQSPPRMSDQQTFVSALTEGTFRTDGMSVSTTPRIYGREKELNQILRAYDTICEPLPPAHCNTKKSIIPTAHTVLLHGPAGIGKTALVEKRLRSEILRRGGYFVLGKFSEARNIVDPHPALVAALTDFCDLLTQHKGFHSSKQANMLKNLSQVDIRRLSLLIGNLCRLISSLERNERMKHEEKLNDKEGNFSCQEQEDETSLLSSSLTDIHLSLRKFLRAVTSAEHPLCICIDNVQWADLPSLELFRLMISSQHSTSLQPHVLMICISREIASNMLHRLSKKEIKAIKMIEMENLCFQSINNIVADELQMYTTSTGKLSAIIRHKTDGNPFYASQYLDQLKNDRYLEYQSEETVWTWNLSRIREGTDVTQNVVENVSQKINKATNGLLLVLKIASAIGFKFDKKLLEAVVFTEFGKVQKDDDSSNAQEPSEEQNPESNVRKKVRKFLEKACKWKIIEKTGYSRGYKFTHRSLRDFFYQMTLEGKEREDLHYQIGKCLKQEMESLTPVIPADWIVFSMADQLNQAGRNIANPLESMELMRVNVKAARLACDKGTFLVAVDYLRSAQAVVEMSTFFDGRHEATKSLLYTFVAEMEYAVGDFPRCQVAAETALAYDINPASKIDAFKVLFDALDVQGNSNEAVQIALQFLREFNSTFLEDLKKSHFLDEFINTRSKILLTPNEELINLPEISDEGKLNHLKVISTFCTMVPINRNEILFLLSVLRMVQLSTRYGVTAVSSYAFANFGIVLASMGHYHEAFRFGDIALRMLERFHLPPNYQAHAMAAIYGGCQHWGKTIKESLMPLMKAYETGKAAGDIKCSWLCAYNYLLGSLESGVKLSQVEIDIRVFCKGLDDMCSQNAVRIMITPVWQKVLNFMGDGDPLQLIGRAMTKDQLDVVVQRGTIFLASSQLSLAYHFDALSVAEQLCVLMEANERLICWHFTIYQILMYSCLTYLRLSEAKNGMKYRVKALRILSRLEIFHQDYNMNCKSIVPLLRGEYITIAEKNAELAECYFKEAIDEATKLGLTHIAALSNERAALANWRWRNFEQSAMYMKQALDLYELWGANAKVEQMKEKYKHIFAGGSENLQTGNSLLGMR